MIVNVNAVPSAGTQASSAYGNVPFSEGRGNIVATVGAGLGTNWIVWSVHLPTVTPGEAFNGMRIEGTHDFLVGGGGASMTRIANALWRMGRSFPADFLSQPYDGGINIVEADGIGHNVNVVCNKAGFTSTDVNNGSLLFGMAATTDSANAASGVGTYRNAILSWTVYTGADLPTPAPGTPGATLSNPPTNFYPGRFPGQTFANAMCAWNDHSLNQPYLDYYWSVVGVPGNTITFANSGTSSWRDISGSIAKPSGWWSSDSGPINVGLTTPPGTYTLRCLVDHSMSGDIYLSSQLVVPLSGGFWWTEA